MNTAASTAKPGVSVVICCHNSAHLLPETISHLRGQRHAGACNWEVLVVDNASTDDTAAAAAKLWGEMPGVGFRVVAEPRLGLAHARLRGLESAAYDVISFIDDDNWVCEDWVTRVYGIFLQDSQIGACGGLNEPVFAVPPPVWFPRFQNSYAVGPQSDAGGDITWKEGVLCGAGLTIRKPAWQQLKADGFEFTLLGRQGRKVLCGEDYELCLALRAAGWKIWYEPALTLRHYLPASRLNWRHLRRMVRKYGFVKLRLAALGHRSYGEIVTREQLLESYDWDSACMRLWKGITRNPHRLFFPNSKKHEGDPYVIENEIAIGEICELLELRNKYKLYIDGIANAKWNRKYLR